MMRQEISPISKKLSDRTKPIIFDTSPLLLLLMGIYDKNAISSFKRLSSYDADDYELLLQFVFNRKIMVTPHVLSEVSNFASRLKSKFFEFLESNAFTLDKIDEKYISKTYILNTPEVNKFGFTDISIILAAKENNALVLTDDFPLYGLCKKIGLDAMHVSTEILSQTEIFK